MSLASFFEKWDTVAYLIYNFFYRVKFAFSKKSNFTRNLKLKNLHCDERCFILMNGPSLNNYDLTLLENEITFCTNHFNRSDVYKITKPNYHIALDKGFFDIKGNKLQKDELEDLIDNNKNCKFIFHSHYLENFKLTDNVYVTYPKHFPGIYGVKNDLHSVTSNFANVSLFAINCAIYMGFKEIYMLGLDFEPGIFNHFYEEQGHELEKKRKNYNEASKSLICERYWGYSMAQYHSFYLSDYAKKNNVKIYNTNNSSYIRSFDFKSFDQIKL